MSNPNRRSTRPLMIDDIRVLPTRTPPEWVERPEAIHYTVLRTDDVEISAPIMWRQPGSAWSRVAFRDGGKWKQIEVNNNRIKEAA